MIPVQPSARAVDRVGQATFTGVRVSAVAFDLDGTIYFGEELADGAGELLGLLERRGVDVTFFTNNSMKTRAAVIEKLVGMGMPATGENTYTSGSAAGAYLLERGWGHVAVLGAEGLRTELEAAGVAVQGDAAAADALVIGLIPDFDFETRPAVLDTLPADCPIVACNMDMTYPVEGGVRKPGCGAIVRAVEAWTGRAATMVVGKPGTFMLERLCADRGLVADAVLVVGDNYDSDIAMARAAGSPSVLIDNDGSAGGVTDVPVVRGLRQLRELLDAALPAEGALRQ